VQFDAQTSSRVLRQRLARAAQEGAPLLRIASEATFSRADSADLLRDAGLLSFQRVALAGDARGLCAFSDGQLARLQFASRIDAAVFVPNDADEITKTLRRVTRISGVPTFCFGVARNAEERDAFLQRGIHRFRGDDPPRPFIEWLWSDRRYTSFTRSDHDPLGDLP
jgi:hypothetical protein